MFQVWKNSCAIASIRSRYAESVSAASESSKTSWVEVRCSIPSASAPGRKWTRKVYDGIGGSPHIATSARTIRSMSPSSRARIFPGSPAAWSSIR